MSTDTSTIKLEKVRKKVRKKIKDIERFLSKKQIVWNVLPVKQM